MSTHYQKITSLFSFIAGSYRNAQRFLQYCYGDSVSFECIRQQVQTQGRRIQQLEEYAFDQNLDKALKSTPTPVQSDPTYLAVDGTMIHLQKQKKKKVKILRKKMN